MRFFIGLIAIILCIACTQKTTEQATSENVWEEKEKTTIAQQKAMLTEKGFKIFDYVDEKTKDTVIMQQYFIAFLKSGPNRLQSDEEAAQLQEAHLAHLGTMYELGYADISGPFGDDEDIKGIIIYNTPTLAMACLLYTSPSPRDRTRSRMPSSA